MAELDKSNLASRNEDGVLVVTFTTRDIQDEKVAEAILHDLLALLDQTGARKLVVDFQNIKYISSVAFRPLLGVRRKLHELGGRLVLCGLSKVIGDVFYTTKLVSTDGSFNAPFELETDVAAAVARLKTEAGA
jgi:anti-anti-sigma factor